MVNALDSSSRSGFMSAVLVFSWARHLTLIVPLFTQVYKSTNGYRRIYCWCIPPRCTSQPRSQGLLRFQNDGRTRKRVFYDRHFESGVGPAIEVGLCIAGVYTSSKFTSILSMRSRNTSIHFMLQKPELRAGMWNFQAPRSFSYLQKCCFVFMYLSSFIHFL